MDSIELLQFYARYYNREHVLGHELFPDRPSGFMRAVRFLCHYATNLERYLSEGDEICGLVKEDIYLHEMPEMAKPFVRFECPKCLDHMRDFSDCPECVCCLYEQI